MHGGWRVNTEECELGREILKGVLLNESRWYSFSSSWQSQGYPRKLGVPDDRSHLYRRHLFIGSEEGHYSTDRTKGVEGTHGVG